MSQSNLDNTSVGNDEIGIVVTDVDNNTINIRYRNNEGDAQNHLTPPASPSQPGDLERHRTPLSEIVTLDSIEDTQADDEVDSDYTDSEDEDREGADTISNERGDVEMRSVNDDGDKNKLERKESKKMNHRRNKLSLPWHTLELTWDYAKVMFICAITTIIGAFVIWAFSKPNYVIHNNGTLKYFHQESIAILVCGFFVSGLTIFTCIQFIAIYGLKRAIDTKFYLWALAALALFTVVPWGMYVGKVSYWYWLGDVILLILGYCGLCFVMGFLGKKYQTTQERRRNALAFLGTETLVSATALLYGMFFIQVYTNFSDYAKIVWRLVIHPIYFEIFMMIPVRLLVTKQMEKKGVSIMHSLAVVHAQAHISTLGRMMISTINEIEFTIISVFLLNIGKLVFRSSVQIRDKYASRVLEKVMGTEHKESKKFVRAVGLFTEMIMENASIPASAFMMWLFYDRRALFFLPYPSGGSFTFDAAVINVVIQIVIAIPFDIITLIINERYFGLPLERAWKKMREKWLPFFGFLIYGVITMGMIGVLWMACRLPRFITCKSENVCDFNPTNSTNSQDSSNSTSGS
ncbi:hypothetical protein PPL_01859 [Heterostelium album PN500]|uniref:Transmembrane protein n=1 Tax=Heterostelium pallidum (strain ATCC 26659 / Pp 5 / PN500) TaxID=670386 RepID=D3B0P2_HETP5|nr:hypothetical protein PPL_01859 [Heterostelium album PN500]EFA84866.1 hypothetical protein PPL_01859 [Heterostelium album PN500]|eukprot:XP_020436977.1 hypothetical protein PPL_01859 [Heterostelium album PN500]